MEKYIEKDFKINIAKRVIKNRLLESGANESKGGLIVKAGFLNTKVTKGRINNDFDCSFTFRDMAGISHTISLTPLDEPKDAKKDWQTKVGYEIVFLTQTQFFIKIHTPVETFRTLVVDVPEEVLLAEYPWKEFMNFVDNKLNIVESNIKLGQNDNINELLK